MTDTGGIVRELYGDEALRPLFDAARRRLEERDLELGGAVALRGATLILLRNLSGHTGQRLFPVSEQS